MLNNSRNAVIFQFLIFTVDILSKFAIINNQRTFKINKANTTIGDSAMPNTDLKHKKHQETYLSHADFLNLLVFKMSLDDIALVDAAYELAKAGHKKQKRDDGTPYFQHCKNTARILIEELGIFDKDMVIAALLHDLIEDAEEPFLRLATRPKLQALFGYRVGYLVAGVSKPRKDDKKFQSDEERHKYYIEEQLKHLNAWGQLLKLCDRLHNTRTIHHCSPEKRARKIKETRDKYLPMVENIRALSNTFANYLKHELLEAIEIAEAVPPNVLGPPLTETPPPAESKTLEATAINPRK